MQDSDRNGAAGRFTELDLGAPQDMRAARCGPPELRGIQTKLITKGAVMSVQGEFLNRIEREIWQILLTCRYFRLLGAYVQVRMHCRAFGGDRGIVLRWTDDGQRPTYLPAKGAQWHESRTVKGEIQQPIGPRFELHPGRAVLAGKS